MKVRALKIFNDLQSKRIRKANEIFEVSVKRAGELSSAHKGTLIEVIEEEKKEVVKEANPKTAKKK